MVNQLSAPDQFPDTMPDSEVQSVLVNTDDPFQARLALKTLSLRRPELAFEEAKRIVVDNTALEELRSTAAIELGYHAPDASSQNILLRTVETAPPGVLKHVFKSLGQVGGRETLERLERVSVQDSTPTNRALQFAKSLISYRLGLDTHLIKYRESPDFAALATERVNLNLRPIDEGEFSAALSSVQRQLPALRLDTKVGKQFVCGHSQYWLVLNETVTQAERTDETLRRQPNIVGATLKYRVCSERYTLDEYIFANGGGKEQVALLGVRPSGSVVHTGVADTGNRQTAFQLQSSNPPYSRPVNLAGTLNSDGNVAFGDVLVGTSREQTAKSSIPARRELL